MARAKPLPDILPLVSAWTIFQNIGPVTRGGCRLWLGHCNKNGYGTCNIDGKRYLVHRVLYKMATGIDPNCLNLNHTCDNPQCCNPDHLWIGTQEQGNKDAVSKRRHAHGETHGRRKLTEAEAKKIKNLKGKLSLRACARRFGVVMSCVSKIQNGVAWKHLK